jgi:preprotein translocase subunit SecE
VARSTRQQRRQRRAQAAGTPPLRPAVRPRPTTEEEPEPRREPAAARSERPDEVRPGTPGIRFVQESIAELKKVEWPNQQQVISGTAVVIVACLIVGAYLYANDQVWSYVVKHVLLR